MTSRTMLQKANRSAAAEKTESKIEAGAIACVVAQTIGLSIGRSHTFSVRIDQCKINPHTLCISKMIGIYADLITPAAECVFVSSM